MDVHRRMMQRRQLLGSTSSSTSRSSSTSKSLIPTSDPLPPTTVTSHSSSSPSTSSTSTLTSTSSSSSVSSSSSSSLSSSSSSTSVKPSLSLTTTTTSSTSQRPFLTTTSSTRSGLTSLMSTPSSTGTSGDVTGSSANVSTGAVVGGIAAGILGLAGIIFAILYFVRRTKKGKEDYSFDSDVFKRQSRVLPDEPHVLPDNDSLFAPRPPMVQRRMDPTSVSNMGGSAYGPGPAYGGYNDYNTGYGHSGFAPGQVIPHNQSYGDSSMGSPISPPTSPPMSVNYGAVGAQQSQSAYLSRQLSTNGPAPVDNSPHYVDLSRSSVTPFQAAQYEEIHRRLNMPPPEPILGSLAEEEYPRNEPIPKGPSPFADPSGDVLPPPSPAHSGRSRVDSTPPKLPELNPPMSPVYALHPVSIDVLSKQTGASADLPAAPTPAHVTSPNPTTPNQKRDTVYTIYDDEDAYAGI